MKRFDLSVGQRLMAGTVAVAILVAVLGTLLFVLVGRVSALRREKIEVIAPRARAANNLERALYQQAVEFRNYVVTGSSEDYASYRRAVEQVRRELEVTAAFPKGPTGQRLFDDLLPIVGEHQASFEDLSALVRAGAEKRAIDEAEDHVSSHREELMRKVRAFAALQAERNQEADLAINRAIDDVRLSVIVITLLILASSIATTWIVGRTVRGPAKELIEASSALSEGDFGPALALEREMATRADGPLQDELREASHVFGGMARALKAREARLAAQARLAGALAVSLDPRVLAEDALREVVAHTGAAIGGVYAADADRPMLRAIASVALGGDLPPVAIGSGIPGEAAAERRTLVVRDIPEDGPYRLHFGFGSAQLRCLVASPMEVKDRVVGVLLVGSLGELDEDAVRFIDQAAVHLAIALDNALAHARIADLASELQAANEELQAQNEELQVQSEELQVQSEELQAQNEELQAQSEELIAQRASLERINEALERAEEQKNRFLAVLGHELRNPLAAISGAAAVLDDGAREDERPREKVRAVIQRQTRHLGRLLDDLLDLSRIATGKVRLDPRRVDLASMAERCVRSLAPQPNGGPHVRLAAPGPVWIHADETRVEQIITNLLTNALKFTPREGTISVTVARDSEGAILRVSDTGAGISKDVLPRVFDLFFQGNDHATTSRGGLGIGLSLVRDLVQMHGGTIRAESEGEGRGTTMTVRFPALADHILITPAAPVARTRVPRSVVVVEDNEDVRHMMKLMLRRAGHTVAEADDGPTGVDAVTKARPDVALIDMDLPGFDGCEVARRLRQDPQLAGLRLVAISGYGRPEDRARALRAGFDEHLVKPVELERLMATLDAPASDA
jgi:signal transduction histidine kinase/CHASE3 domain sensor protein/ActR/RegA family two-component response regulator